LGPQSEGALGEQRLLIVAVRFPDVTPKVPLQKIRSRVVTGFDAYVKEVSYGRTWLKSDAALKAALEIQQLVQRYPKPRSAKADRLIKESVESFKKFNF